MQANCEALGIKYGTTSLSDHVLLLEAAPPLPPAIRRRRRAYKLRRVAAAARGEGFMSFKTAEARLRQAMIPILMSGAKPAIGSSLFATIFCT